MKEKELNVQGAGRFAWAAAQDAHLRDIEARATYSPKERAQMQTVFDIIDSTYTSKRSYMNFRKGFVAIKLEEASLRDKEARDFNLWCEHKNITRVRTDQGIIFRVPRSK